MQIRLEKITELENAVVPNNKEVGYFKEGEMRTEPIVGERFWLGWGFSTSPVTEIINKDTFKTLNSIYKIHRLIN